MPEEPETISAEVTETPTKQISEAIGHISEATQQVGQAVVQAPSDALSNILTNVGQVLQGVQAELKRSNDIMEKQTQTSVVPAEEVVTEVVTPPKEARHVRRPGMARKVKR